MTKFYTMHGGKKMIKGKLYEDAVGSRAEVWHGKVHHTKGNLTKPDLMKNKRGRIVSRRKSSTAKREKRLVKAGYKTRKGMFGFIKDAMSSRRHRGSRKSRRTRKHRGGNGINYPLAPAHFDGKGVGTSGVEIQFQAGNATS